MAKKQTNQTALEALLADMKKAGLPVGNIGDTVEAVSSGISSFDLSTGVGGLPRGRMSLFQGKEAGGKTLLALRTIASEQQRGGLCGFVDAEHALTPSFAELLGVSWADLVTSRPRTMNDAYDVARAWWSSGLFDVVVIDSAVASATVEEIEASARSGGKRAGLAQLHSQELRKMVSTIDDRTALIMINQLRVNPNPPRWWKGGEMLYAPGGRALRFYSSLTVDVKTDHVHTRKGRKVGQHQKTLVIKNKVGPPFVGAQYDLMFATGVDLVSDLVSTGIATGVVESGSGGWLKFEVWDDGELAETLRKQGREAFEEAIREDDFLYENLRDQVMTLAGDRVVAGDDYDPEEVVDEEDM